MKQTHWMIGRLGQPVHDANFPPRLNRSSYDGVVKQAIVDDLRAGERKEDPPLAKPTQGLGVEAFVALYGIVSFGNVFGKGRWIHHHDLVDCSVATEELEDVLHVGFVYPGKRRFSRWSKNKPVFCPVSQSTQKRWPYSRTSPGAAWPKQ